MKKKGSKKPLPLEKQERDGSFLRQYYVRTQRKESQKKISSFLQSALVLVQFISRPPSSPFFATTFFIVQNIYSLFLRVSMVTKRVTIF